LEEQAVSRLAIQQFMNYSSGFGGAPDAHRDSTTSHMAADPDTHQDFQRTSKSSGMSLHDIVAQVLGTYKWAFSMGLFGYAFSRLWTEKRENQKIPTKRLNFSLLKLNAASLAAHVLN
jgi:hypothetical protein